MIADIISIGDELLIGQTINTNASWLGQQLSDIGIRIRQQISISDEEEVILNTLSDACKNSKLVVITGGLGPTKDDITKHTLCRFFDTKLVLHEPTLRHVEAFFKKYNRPMLEVNILQAHLPESCQILFNKNGTAPGMWFDYHGTIVVSLPGVPYEMKSIFEDEIIPKLKTNFDLKSIYHSTLLTQGIGESFLAEKIEDWENKVRAEGFGLAYLPSPGMVKLRLTSYNGTEDQLKIQKYFDELITRFPQHVYGWENDTLSQVVGELLLKNNLSIGTVESCTSGSIAAEIVATPGASNYYKASFLTYTEEMKSKILGISMNDISENGVVSEEIVKQMAKNGMQKLGVDVCISTTGYVGPTGGDGNNPIGSVWVGVAYKNELIAKRFQFGNNRERNIHITVLSALNLVRCKILGINF